MYDIHVCVCVFQNIIYVEYQYTKTEEREAREEDCRIREWSARFLSYRGIHIYLHIARLGATVVPRSRVQAREALPRASSRNEQPPFSE